MGEMLDQYLEDQMASDAIEGPQEKEPIPVVKIYRPHQKKMNKYVHKVQHPFLFVHMRLGKTLVTVRRVEGYGLTNILIVAPYAALDAWRAELQNEGISYTELLGTGKERRELLPGLGGWVLTNKEVWRTVPEIAKMNWHVRILDESTFIKSPFARVTKFFNDPDLWPGLLHDWRLTGTPNPESDIDFYGQTFRIWPQKTFFSWRGHWCTPYGTTWRVKPLLKQKFYGILAQHCFFMSREDAGIAVRRVYQTRLIRLPKDLRAIYRKLVKEFVLKIPEGQSWETTFAGVKYSWLKRLCGGALPDPEGKIRGWWDGKLKELTYLLTTELKGEPGLIWAHFKEEVERVAAHIKAPYIHGGVSQKRRTELIRDFRAGKFPHLVAQPGCIAYSTDASHCDYMIYYSSPESGEIRKQSEARTEMVDKKEPSLIIDLIAEDTVDEKIARGHIQKESRTETARKIVQHLQEQL